LKAAKAEAAEQGARSNKNMNKKTLIILASAIGLIIIIGFLFLRLKGEKKENGSSFISRLFPESQEKSALPPDKEAKVTTENGKAAKEEKTLTQLTSSAVSGAAFHAQSGKVRYFEKATGHLYEINPDGTDRKKISITTIPGVFKVRWSPDASGAILQYIEEDVARTFVVPALATSTEGVLLPTTTSEVAISPSGDSIFYLMENKETEGIVASWENQNKKEILTLPIGEFTTAWPQSDLITLLTKPSALFNGYLYKLNPTNGSLTKLLGEAKGLTILYSPHENKIIYSQSANKDLTTKIYNLHTKESIDLGAKTLPEKCLFSDLNTDRIYCAVPRTLPTADYPDDWYQGLISFSDNLWEINTLTGTAKIIFSENFLDITDLFSDAEENYLFFVNKKDSTLWSFKLEH
jgi:hypothetical protein